MRRFFNEKVAPFLRPVVKYRKNHPIISWIVGVLFILLGFALLVLPGPGSLFILLGLVLIGIVKVPIEEITKDGNEVGNKNDKNKTKN